jgi:hypothetical protein
MHTATATNNDDGNGSGGSCAHNSNKLIIGIIVTIFVNLFRMGSGWHNSNSCPMFGVIFMSLWGRACLSFTRFPYTI